MAYQEVGFESTSYPLKGNSCESRSDSLSRVTAAQCFVRSIQLGTHSMQEARITFVEVSHNFILAEELRLQPGGVFLFVELTKGKAL